MKCKYCGANILTEEVKCPFCGMDNPAGIEELNKLNEAEEYNKELDKNVKKNSKWKILFTVWNIINIGLLVIFIVSFLVASTTFEGAGRKMKGNKLLTEVENYYNYSDMDGLYRVLNENDGFTDEDIPSNYKQVALIYNAYGSYRYCYASVISDYESLGYSSSVDVEKCVGYAVDVYSGSLSSLYSADKLSNEDWDKIEEMRQEAKEILTKVFNVPEEMLDEIDGYDNNQRKTIIEYALKEWPCD